MCANSLEVGCDCLGFIRYFDAHLTTRRSEPLVVKNAIYVHKKDFGTLWKHIDRRLGKLEVRRSRRLVVPSVPFSRAKRRSMGREWRRNSTHPITSTSSTSVSILIWTAATIQCGKSMSFLWKAAPRMLLPPTAA